MEVPNSVLTENIVDNERRFRTWRFKPGQRGHVRLPQQTWDDQLVLPADAVVEDGIDYVMFRRMGVHRHPGEEPHADFQKVVLTVRYKDQYTVVAENDGQVKPWHEFAMNNADMLMRAMNSGEGGGGHSHHGHEH